MYVSRRVDSKWAETQTNFRGKLFHLFIRADDLLAEQEFFDGNLRLDAFGEFLQRIHHPFWTIQ